MADRRDDPSWVAVELTPSGETLVVEGSIAKTLRRDLSVSEEHGVFVPAKAMVRGGSRTLFHLMEGYVFVESGLDEVAYFALENRSYVNKVLSTVGGSGLRTLHVISDAQVREMRRKLLGMVTADIPLGSMVLIEEGQYKNLEGKVLGAEGDDAFVRITLRSLDIVVTTPKIFLSEKSETEDS